MRLSAIHKHAFRMMVRHFLFSQGKILLHRSSEGTYALPCSEKWPDALASASPVALPSLDGIPCEGVMIDALPDILPEDCVAVPLREAYAYLSSADYRMAGKAEELLYWHRQSRYCGACGAELHEGISVISKCCPSCQREYWPVLAPAVIVLIMRDDDHILLVRSNSLRRYYGLVAGFVETGESLEECLVREVAEETGLEVSDIRYFGSQPWPYPNSLMVGFTARYAGGQLVCADGELTEAAWFSRDNLPAIPPPPSMARMLIEAWYERRLP